MSASLYRGFVLTVILTVVSPALHSSDGECSTLKNRFVQLGLGPPSMVPNSMVHDSDMAVCYLGSIETSKSSCCTRQMERKFQQAAEEKYMLTVRDTSSYLKNLLTSNTALYQNKFFERLEAASNATLEILTGSYQVPRVIAAAHLDSLFLDLQHFLRQQHVSIPDAVSQFFDNLFPLIFRYALNDPTLMAPQDDDFAACLRRIRADLLPRPFGEIPGHLSRHLENSLSSARLFLQSMNLGIETLNTTDYLTVDDSCSAALTRLTSCSLCHGLSDARPCPALCKNVLHGCLAHTARLDEPWDAFVDALHSMTSEMRGLYDVEEAMTGLADHISDAIMHAMDKAHLYHPAVVRQCGPPKTSGQVPSLHRASLRSHLLPPVTGSEVKLRDKLSMLMRHLVASKGYYGRLAETLCTSEVYAGESDTQCWNGRQVGSYEDGLTSYDLDTQVTGNPEVHVSPVTPPALALLTDKLHHSTKLLLTKTSEAAMQADDVWSSYGGSESYEGSGDYSMRQQHGYPEDDEDSDLSGSGSGSEPEYNKKFNHGHRIAVGNKPSNSIEDGIVFVEATDASYIVSTERHNLGYPGNTGSSSLATMASLLLALMLCVILRLDG